MTLSAISEVAGMREACSGAATQGDARFDLRQRAIVDDAIGVLAGSNMMSAFEYLRTHGIALHVIERVLLEPMRRRARL